MAADISLAILSNKPHELTLRCVADMLPRWTFSAVYGARDSVPPKPDPTGLTGIFEELAIPKERWLYVGDSDVDMQTGRSAEVSTLGVSWGFRGAHELKHSGAHGILDRPLELLRWLDPDGG